MIKKALESMNLSDKESETYLILLKSGALSIQEISDKTKINRTYCYEIIKNLLDKGMIASVKQERGQKYLATKPKSLLLLLKEKEEILKKALPELEKLTGNQINLPKIELFEGNKGIKVAMSEALKLNKEIVGFSSRDFIEYMNYYLPNFAKERVKNKIPIRLLLNDSKWTKKWLSEFNNKKELRKIKFHKYKEDFKSTIYIFGDSTLIIFLSKKNPLAVLINDSNYSTTQKLIFEQLWKK